MRQYKTIITNMRKETVMTKVHIEGEITDPVKEGATVMRWFLHYYFKKNPSLERRKAAIMFIDGVKDELLKWVYQLEEFDK